MNRTKIKTKEFLEFGVKIIWQTQGTYSLGDENKSCAFNVKILDKNNKTLKEEIVEVPAVIMETWAKDEVITNYILSQLELELDLDNTIDLVLEKLNLGTIVYASGTQEENDIILKNYATFIALQIESYKEGNIEIDDFFEVPSYNVNIVSEETDFTIKAFVKSLIGKNDTEKRSLLDSCFTAIEQAIINENNLPIEPTEPPMPTEPTE